MGAGDVVLYEPYQNASMKFSFFIDSSISRVNLYVQAQVTITLAASGTRRRMRALLQTDTASATRHFDGATGIGGEVLVPEEILDDDDVVGDATNPETTDTPVWITAGVCVGIANLLLFGVCLFVYCYKKKGNNKTQDIMGIMKQMQDNKEAKNNDVYLTILQKKINDENGFHAIKVLDRSIIYIVIKLLILLFFCNIVKYTPYQNILLFSFPPPSTRHIILCLLCFVEPLCALFIFEQKIYFFLFFVKLLCLWFIFNFYILLCLVSIYSKK